MSRQKRGECGGGPASEKIRVSPGLWGPSGGEPCPSFCGVSHTCWATRVPHSGPDATASRAVSDALQ